MSDRLPPILTNYEYEIVLTEYPCGCVTGRADATRTCPAFEALRSAGDYAGCVDHLRAIGGTKTLYKRVTQWDAQDRSKVSGMEETPEQMRKRMIGH